MEAIDRDTPALSSGDILIAEFNYIAQTATQANEDRARITSLYFVTVGTLIAAIFGASVSTTEPSIQFSVRIAFLIIFLGLSLHSLLTILQLVRLRLAWIDSAQAMNSVKDYYVSHLKNPNIEVAFRWKSATIPPKFKANSVSAILAIQVASLGGLAFGSSVFFLGLALQNMWWAPSFVLGGLFILMQLTLYKFLLK
jgi:hypothetical protein